jgi:hypothetical protein
MNAPVIAASPPIASADQAKTSVTNTTIAVSPSLIGCRSTHATSQGSTNHPNAADNARYSTILATTPMTETSPLVEPASARKMERMIKTNTSSTTAAPSSVIPSRVLSTPSSSKVCAEMLTLVAVRMMPINHAV